MEQEATAGSAPKLTHVLHERIRIQKSATHLGPMPLNVRPRNDNNQVIKVLEKITTTSDSGKDTTITTLIEFFDDVVAGKHNVGFPWWGWALCIGGGVGVLFAIFLVITKTRKH